MSAAEHVEDKFVHVETCLVYSILGFFGIILVFANKFEYRCKHNSNLLFEKIECESPCERYPKDLRELWQISDVTGLQLVQN